MNKVKGLTGCRTIRKLKLPKRRNPTELPASINGIFIEYQFDMERHELETIGVSFFILLVVLGWKLATGDWNVAAAFGSLVVALLTLAYSRSKVMIPNRVKTTKVD